jgi:hypothetical protein
MKLQGSIDFLAALLLAASVACADRIPTLPTAKQAVQAANLKLDPGARNQVVIIEGRNSDTDLRLRQWDMTFFDTNKLGGGAIVRVKDGAVVGKSTSVRMFDDARWNRFGRNFTGYEDSEIINPSRWRIDSDEAIKSALGNSKLTGWQVTQAIVTLRKLSDGDVPPVWRIKLRARPVSNPRRERWVGYLQFNGETGELLRDELRIEEP